MRNTLDDVRNLSYFVRKVSDGIMKVPYDVRMVLDDVKNVSDGVRKVCYQIT